MKQWIKIVATIVALVVMMNFGVYLDVTLQEKSYSNILKELGKGGITSFASYSGPGACGTTLLADSHDLTGNVPCGGTFGNAFTFSNDNTFMDCRGFITTGDGASFVDTFVFNTVNTNVTAINCILNDGEDNLFFTSANNVVIKDSSLTTGGNTVNDLHFLASSNISLVNVTFSGTIQFDDAVSNFTRQWYLDVQVNWTNGTAASGASVNAFNTTDVANFSGSTDANGYVRLEATDYINHGGAISNYSTYNVSAQGSGFNSTTIVLSTNQQVQLTIAPAADSSPTINPIQEFDPDYVAPNPQNIGDNITFAANVTDDVNVSNVWVNISNSTSPEYQYQLNFIGNDTYELNLETTFLGIGTRNFTVYANDTINNLVNSGIQNFTLGDYLKPSIANISISPFYPSTASSVFINATINDNYAVNQSWVEIIRPDGVATNYTMSNTGSLYNYTYTTPSVLGRYTVYLYANDTSGNLRSTTDQPRYFHIPPVVLTDKDVYIQTQTIQITGFGFNVSENITITIGNSTNNITQFNTNSTGTGTISTNYIIPENTTNGKYTVYAYDADLATTVFKNIEIEGVTITYPAGSIVIPGDDKQNPNAYDLDFLEMYGVIYNTLNNSYKVDWIITPDCRNLNATNVDTSQHYEELFCHGFWLIKDNVSGALSYINGIRDSVQILTLDSEAQVPKAQIIQLRRQPRVALLSGSHGQIVSTLTRSEIPYELLSESRIQDNTDFNTSFYDILMIGDYDFAKAPATLAGNISRFVNNGGDVHAEDLGALTLDALTNFTGNLTEDGRYKGDTRVLIESNPITQTQLMEFANSHGTVSVLDTTGETNPSTKLLGDNNYDTDNNYAKLISAVVGKGFITYTGGHIGSSQGSSGYARAKNRILDNLILYAVQINDLTEPETWNLTPSAATNISQYGTINISAYVTDNVAVDTVLALIEWNSNSQIVTLSGPDIFSFYEANFSNTSIVTRYNITITANDSRGNIKTATTYFNVLQQPNNITEVNLISPLNTEYKRRTFNLTYNVSDLDGLSDVENCSLYTNIDNLGYTVFNLTTNVSAINYIEYFVNSSQNLTNTTDWYVNCTDKAVTVTTTPKTFFVDNVNPTPYFNYPLVDNSTNHTNTTLNLDIKIEDNNLQNASITIISSSNTTVYSDYNNVSAGTEWINFTAAIDTSSWTTGTYHIYLNASDMANNQLSITREFTFTDTSTPAAPTSTSSGGGSGGCKTAWVCDIWSECINGLQLRTCKDLNKCNRPTDKPAETQDCCTPVWDCTSWSDCTDSSQSRTCTDINKCNISYSQPAETQGCGRSSSSGGCMTNSTCTDWTECMDGKQTRDCTDLSTIEPEKYCSIQGFQETEILFCESPENICIMPWEIILTFMIAALAFQFMTRYDKKPIPREKAEKLINLSKIKVWLSLIIIITSIILYYDVCLPYTAMDIFLIIFCMYVISSTIIHYENYNEKR